MQSVLALIPARGGSKRIPGKNIRLLGGVPLIGHTISAAQKADCFSQVLVSTDDAHIAEISKQCGADVPWLRSAEASTDTSTSVSVILEVLDRLEQQGNLPDAVMLLQPTSPFRTVQTIRQAYDLYQKAGGESVVSVSPAKNHPFWCKKITHAGEMLPFIEGAPTNLRSQDLPPAYALNGLVYVSSVQNLRLNQSFYSDHTKALLVQNPEEDIDIDTPFDWRMAETILKAQKEETA